MQRRCSSDSASQLQRRTAWSCFNAKQACPHVKPERRAKSARASRVVCRFNGQVNWDDAVTTVSSSGIRASGLRPETVHLLYSWFFRTHAYADRRWETCPRGKRVSSTEKPDDIFRCPTLGIELQTRLTLCLGCAAHNLHQTPHRFPLTTPGLSQRIATMPLQRPF
jgi:hypothetical protein